MGKDNEGTDTHTLIVVEKYAASAVSATRTLRKTGGPADAVAPASVLDDRSVDVGSVPEIPAPAAPPRFEVVAPAPAPGAAVPVPAAAPAPVPAAAVLRFDCERCLDIIRRDGRRTIFASTAWFCWTVERIHG